MGRRRREERIEIHERLIVRTASGSLPALCDACSAGDGIPALTGTGVDGEWYTGSSDLPVPPNVFPKQVPVRADFLGAPSL